MLEQKKLTSVKVAPPFPLPVEKGRIVATTIEDYAVSLFADTGRTVMVTRRGEAPTSVPLRYYDEVRDTDVVCTVATDDEIKELMKIREMRKRFQILESVPYTHIIIGHEVSTEAQLALKRKKVENFDEGLRIAEATGKTIGMIAWQIIKISAVVAYGVVILALGLVLGALCGKDPVVWARLPDGEWLQLARYYE